MERSRDVAMATRDHPRVTESRCRMQQGLVGCGSRMPESGCARVQKLRLVLKKQEGEQ